jgi:hypothetical protein
MYPQIRPLLSLGGWIHYLVLPPGFGFGGHVFAYSSHFHHNTLESWRF